MEADSIDMEDDLKMTVSIWKMTISIWAILSLWSGTPCLVCMSELVDLDFDACILVDLRGRDMWRGGQWGRDKRRVG
jgi:hypothetical protein